MKQLIYGGSQNIVSGLYIKDSKSQKSSGKIAHSVQHGLKVGRTNVIKWVLYTLQFANDQIILAEDHFGIEYMITKLIKGYQKRENKYQSNKNKISCY